MRKSVLVEKARLFALAAHSAIGHKRKYTNEPYINHPEAVAKIVESVSYSEEMIAAAWLHDVVEDTEISIEMIEQEFGRKVAKLVSDLTDVSVPSDGNRAARKLVDLKHTSEACNGAKTIKLADLIDNSSSILEHDPVFAKVYLEEKAALLNVLAEGGVPSLWNRANEIVIRNQLAMS